MKSLMATLFALSAAAALTACGGPKTPTSTVNRNGRLPMGNSSINVNGPVPGGSVTQTPTAPGQGLPGWGQVVAQSDAAVDAFLSTDFQPGDIGSVTAQGCRTGAGYPCAIEFTVTQQAQPNSFPLAFTSGNLLTDYNSGMTSQFQGGYLTLIIWDSFSGTPDQNGNPLSPIPVIIPLNTQASGVAGGQVVMVFQDQYGSVTFDGQISGNGWVGVGAPQSLTFSNSMTVVNGQGPQSGYLGAFGVVACGVMACQ